MSISGPTPDLAGFADSQERLRQNFGRVVCFYGRAAMIYDPALTAGEFDDEGIPLDPLAHASAVASAAVEIADLTLLGSAQVLVVSKPLSTSILRRDETFEDQLGMRSGLNRDLILNPADYPLASGASYFQIGTLNTDGSWTPEDGHLWKVVNVKSDSAIGNVERLIVYGEDTR